MPYSPLRMAICCLSKMAFPAADRCNCPLELPFPQPVQPSCLHPICRQCSSYQGIHSVFHSPQCSCYTSPDPFCLQRKDLHWKRTGRWTLNFHLSTVYNFKTLSASCGLICSTDSCAFTCCMTHGAVSLIAMPLAFVKLKSS